MKETGQERRVRSQEREKELREGEEAREGERESQKRENKIQWKKMDFWLARWKERKEEGPE